MKEQIQGVMETLTDPLWRCQGSYIQIWGLGDPEDVSI